MRKVSSTQTHILKCNLLLFCLHTIMKNKMELLQAQCRTWSSAVVVVVTVTSSLSLFIYLFIYIFSCIQESAFRLYFIMSMHFYVQQIIKLASSTVVHNKNHILFIHKNALWPPQRKSRKSANGICFRRLCTRKMLFCT